MRNTETYTAKVVWSLEKAGGMRRDGFAMGGGGRKNLCRFGRGRGVPMNQLVYHRVGWFK
jgi:hypothetical protein